MKTILDKIAATKRSEIAALKQCYKLSDFESMEYFDAPTRSLKTSLLDTQFSVIAEFKRKSPSAGIINDQKSPVHQARQYESLGAGAISCLTDKTYFGGNLDDLKNIRGEVQTPVLRKDFILDEIQIFEAKAYGADAVLLISEILDSEHAKQLTIIAQSLGMDVLMEAHDRDHLERINDMVDVIGINNRNLHLQRTSIQTSFDLIKYLPKNCLCISESGIKSPDELKQLETIGYRGALIGESLMNENDNLIYRSPLKQCVS